MCGIIGYTGSGSSTEHLFAGLHALEYRGYDSAGIAIFDREGHLRVLKAKGRVCNVESKALEAGIDSVCGIGHTRWATHGEPSDQNSHPHGTARVQIVHNGIIENYVPLREKLRKAGYTFYSETDTEVAAKLIDLHYGESGDPRVAMQKAAAELAGSYAIGAVFADYPGRIYAMRKDNPLIIGCGEGENFIASDITALLRYTRNYYQLEEGELAIVESGRIAVIDRQGNYVSKEMQSADWDVEAAEKGGYAHFMLKEINEEPDALVKTLHPRITDGLPDFSTEKISEEVLSRVERVCIVACGTAMHAGLVGKYMLEHLAKLPVTVEIASEFRYNDPILSDRDLVIVISQSGETADSLAALRLAKEKGAPTLAVVNVISSSIAREADEVLYTWAGPEIAVASTKAYTVQTALMTLFAVHMALLRGKMSDGEAREIVDELQNKIPQAISEVIARSDEIRETARRIAGHASLFFIGRGIDYCLAMEGSLKLKEISYIHSEAYAAGELKHGTISLITKGIPVIALATNGVLFEKTLSNIKEVKARGAYVVTVYREGDEAVMKESDSCYCLPHTSERLAFLCTAAWLQLLAYYTALELGRDVDKPRNLAKSVTVE